MSDIKRMNIIAGAMAAHQYPLSSNKSIGRAPAIKADNKTPGLIRSYMTFAFDSSSLRAYGSVLMICAAQNLLQASPLSMAAHAKGTESVVSIFHINP